MQPLLKLDQVKKIYGTDTNIVKAIDDVSMTIDKGEFVAIMGSSGSGKTTLLNCISTIDTVTSGNIYLENEDITTISEKLLATFRRDKLGFIFQDFQLLDTLTIKENISLALTLSNTNPHEVDKRIIEISKTLGIEDILDKFPYETSGGQKQRTACARALINNPKLLLADEPTGALDSKSSEMLLETLLKMNGALNSTILMVTHDAFSASYTNRVLFLKDGRLFNEIRKGNKSKRQFFNEILDSLSLLGGSFSDVR